MKCDDLFRYISTYYLYVAYYLMLSALTLTVNCRDEELLSLSSIVALCMFAYHEGLYAVGEVSAGVHGRNRLGGDANTI